MLRIAVPNKGSLSEGAVHMLTEAGYRCRRSGRELVMLDKTNDVEFFFLRPRDIAVYVGQGTVEAGITGRDLLQDSGQGAIEIMPLDFAKATFRFAAPRGTMTDISQLHGKRLATSFDLLVQGYLRSKSIDCQVVHLDGAVESSVKLGVADAIADVVETGSTLRAAGLEVFGEPILASEAILITTEPHRHNEQLKRLISRLEGVKVAHTYVLMDYNVPVSALDAATDLTPGVESPTISPLQDSSWMAVRAMVKKDTVHQTMDDLYALGARGILVSEISACRL